MKLSTQRNIIVILVVLAIILGIGIAQKVLKSRNNTTPVVQKTQPSQNLVSSAPKLTNDEQEVLKMVGTNASSQDQKNQINTAIKIAQTTKTLEIPGCFGNPVVARVKYKSDLEIHNPDTIAHIIIFDKKRFYTIPPGKTITVPIDFPQGPGLYGYGCGGSGEPRGRVLVTQ